MLTTAPPTGAFVRLSRTYPVSDQVVCAGGFGVCDGPLGLPLSLPHAVNASNPTTTHTCFITRPPFGTTPAALYHTHRDTAGHTPVLVYSASRQHKACVACQAESAQRRLCGPPI